MFAIYVFLSLRLAPEARRRGMLCRKGQTLRVSLYEFRDDGETLVAGRSVRFGKAEKAKFCV